MYKKLLIGGLCTSIVGAGVYGVLDKKKQSKKIYDPETILLDDVNDNRVEFRDVYPNKHKELSRLNMDILELMYDDEFGYFPKNKSRYDVIDELCNILTMKEVIKYKEDV